MFRNVSFSVQKSTCLLVLDGESAQAIGGSGLNGSDYASHAQQDRAIHAYLRWHNRNSHPAKPWRINAEVHHSLPDIAA